MIFLKSLNKKIGIALVGIIYFNAYCAAEVQTKQLSVFSCIKDSYIKSLDINSEPEVAVDTKQKLKLQIQYPSRDIMCSMVINQMAKQSHDSLKQKRTILDRTFIDKMELLAGSGSPKNSLLSALDNTDTIFGHIMLAGQLAEPIFDSAELIKKQAIIQELLQNSELAQKIQEQLDIIKANEGYFLSYFEKENAVNQELFKKVYWGDRFDFLNNYTLPLELKTRLNNAGTAFSLSFVPMMSFLIRSLAKMSKVPAYHKDGTLRTLTEALKEGMKIAIKTLPQEADYRLDAYKDFAARECNVWDGHGGCTVAPFSQLSLEDRQNNIIYTTPYTLGDKIYLLKNITKKPRIVLAGIHFGIPALITAYYIYSAYNTIQEAQLKQSIYDHLQTKMMGVASYIKAVENLYAIINANPILAASPTTKVLREFINGVNLSPSAQKLASMLNCNTFNGNASVFSLTGRVLAAHRLMQEIKEEFVPACAAAGSLDVYLSTAKLYKKFENTPACFCFVDYVVDAQKPFITAKNFWNPFIDATEVVANDLVMGLEGFPNNMILTGPNTGGKSTVIKGLLISILLGQTLGIAPADQLMITPFANLNCYLNITDDLNAGTSLFKAEVLRAKALIEAINNLGANEFSFTIIDEVFSGTSPKEGEEAALQFASNIGEKANSICCMATHFPRLTEELSDVNYKNYSVTVYKDEAGKWVRPFKLAEGKSIMNIALDLLREEGVLN